MSTYAIFVNDEFYALYQDYTVAKHIFAGFAASSVIRVVLNTLEHDQVIYRGKIANLQDLPKIK